jgi:penicillin-binding protein 2
LNYLIRKRVVVVFWMFFLFFIALIVKVCYIQVFSGPQLSKQALAQQSHVVALEFPNRGRILDCRMTPFSMGKKESRVVVFPFAIQDKQKTALALAKVLGIQVNEAEKYTKGNSRTILIGLSVTQAVQLKKAALSGVTVAEAVVRPRKPSLASHIIGFWGKGQLGTEEGKMGLELFYDRILRGAQNQLAVRLYVNGKGRVIPGLGYSYENIVDKTRRDIVLTIDCEIQKSVENVMDSAGVKEGAAVVMDIRTGDIKAMASRPDYTMDAVYAKAYEKELSFLNRCLSLYQPGSVFKVVIAAAALEEGLVKPDTLFLCAGAKDQLVRCYNPGGHGVLNFAQAVAYSCNPVFARVGVKLGAKKIIEYAKKFGFAKGELLGYKSVNTEEKLNSISGGFNVVNASLGQWPVEANAVQITAMMAAVANDGIFNLPRLVCEIRNYNGIVAETVKEGTPVKVVSLKTADTLQIMLEMTTRYGTGRQAWLEPGGSAGKTGSAQVGDSRIDAWFCGYAPLKQPQYAITILVTDGESGGQTAAPIFREILKNIMSVKNAGI